MGLLSKQSDSKNPSKKSSTLGYLEGFDQVYTLGRKLGKGGSGTVHIATKNDDGREFAVKIIPKILRDPRVSEKKREDQIPSIIREVEVMLALRGNLNIANLEAVYEDGANVLLVQELCRGGELLEQAGQSHHVHYSERSVASILRSVLQTIAMCHARHILHRDIKPENFLFHTTDPSSPIKAIDFGLAVYCPPSSLPLVAATAEGTPWYLAPEVCKGRSYPASDVWSCGVMAAYLLTGVYPFIDRMNPEMPDLARTLKVICFEELDQSRPEWQGLSNEALDFVKSLLVKDPLKRPSALKALSHPWLNENLSSSKKYDKPLHRSVVQRIQRFAHSSMFKRRVLECIAADLVKMHFSRDKSVHGGAVFNERSIRGGRAYFEGSRRGGNTTPFPATDGSVRSGSGNNSMHFSRRPSSRDVSYHIFSGSMAGPDRSMHRTSSGQVAPLPAGVYLPIATPYSYRLSVVLDSISPDKNGRINKEDLISSLHKLGYKLNDQEAGELFDAVDVLREGSVQRDQLSASLLDWKWVQDTYKDRWVESVKRVFADFDKDGDGTLTADELADAFSGQLSSYEVDAAVHQALIEAVDADDGTLVFTAPGDAATQEQGIDFDHFLQLLQVNADNVGEDLALYDDRLSNHTSRNVSGDVNAMIKAQRESSRKKNGGGLFSCCFS